MQPGDSTKATSVVVTIAVNMRALCATHTQGDWRARG